MSLKPHGKKKIKKKGISVSIWLKHQFETKMSLLDVKNLNNSLGTGYGQRE
jgi:hypothetical protein